MSRVFSAPKAYIEIDSVPAGYVQNLSWSENLQRQSITGLGQLIEQEAPVVSQRNTFNIGTFFISLNETIIKKVLNREATVEEYINSALWTSSSFQSLSIARRSPRLTSLSNWSLRSTRQERQWSDSETAFSIRRTGLSQKAVSQCLTSLEGISHQ